LAPAVIAGALGCRLQLNRKGNDQMNMKKYYSQLVGFTIQDFRFESDEYSLEPFPIFTIRKGGETLDVTLSMDSEGNGGGFAFIEPPLNKEAV
jgi:hypothetical protein